MIVMLAVGLVILLAATAFSVDVAYMHLTRAELHVATSVAAKAAVTGLAIGGSETYAKNQAIAYAAKNTVAGAPLRIDASNITLGKVTYISDGRWTFTPGGTPLTAATVDVDMTSGSTAGAVNLFFGRLFGRSTFSPRMTSTAAFVRNKVCLCLDRSRSMTFDTSGTDNVFPSSSQGWPYGVPPTLQNTSDVYYRYLYPPCNGSRWYYLVQAANTFLDILGENTVETPVSLITWGSDESNNHSWAQLDATKQYCTYTGTPVTDANGNITSYSITLNKSKSVTYFDAYTVDSTFCTSYGGIRSAIKAKGYFTMLGGTDMNGGLKRAVQLFLDDAKTDTTPWNRIIILFSDGCYTTTNPVTDAAVAAKNANIIVHTVGFLLNSSDSALGAPTLQGIASVTGGRCYIATSGAQLETAFRELARSLPVILTQ
jgi:Ca-activated chloride channel family protein